MNMKMKNRSRTGPSSTSSIQHNHFLPVSNISFCYRTISEGSFQG